MHPILPLPKELRRKAEKELNENPIQTAIDLNHIRDWIAQQPHIIARTDDKSLLNFLRHAKFSLERTKERIDTYYTARSLAPELFENRNPFLPEMQEVLNRGIISVIEDTSQPLLPVTIVIRWQNSDTEKAPVQNLMKVALMSLNIIINKQIGCTVNGFHVIQDFQGLPFNYLKQFTPTVVQKLVRTVQEGYPLRVKGLHLLNLPSFMEAVFLLTRSLLKEKLRKRTYSYGKNYTGALAKNVPLSLIPYEYGGTADPLDKIAEEWKKTVESYSDWFIEDSKYGTDEPKRMEKSKLSEQFGVDGSFRNLAID